MPYTLDLTQSQILTSLRAVLLAILPSGIEVIRGQDNRVPEPKAADFVVMTPILRDRLATNVETAADVSLTGSMSAKVLTVSDVSVGSIVTPALLFGTDVAAGTIITSQTSGVAGGIGVYAVSVSQTLTSRTLASGALALMQPVQVTVQCDIHGPASGENSHIVSTIMRSDHGCRLFADQGRDVTPLYASDPRETAFNNAESQVEQVWSIDVVMQANPVLTVPQQFADVIEITPVSVDATFAA
jgi:hypothetical protein